MRLFRNAPKRWVIPTALAAVLVSALFISPAIGGPKFVTGQKVVKTINKKVNAAQITSTPAKLLGTAEATYLTLNLTPGNYVVSSTFDVRRDATNTIVTCSLRIVGVSQDQYQSFHSGGGPTSMEDGAAMEIAGKVGTASEAQLLCSASAGAASIKNVEITALKVPVLKRTTG